VTRVAFELLSCLLASGFFAGLETGMLAANRMVLQEKQRRGVLYARAAEYLLRRPARLLGVTLIGTNLANVAAAVILTDWFDQIGHPRIAWAGVLALTLAFVVFADLIPKSFFRANADGLTVRLTPLLVAFYFVLMPLYAVLNAIVQAIMLLTGQNRGGREEVRSRRDLRFLVHLAGQEVGLSRDDQRIIEDILDFREQSAREVMTPFHKVPVVTYGQSVDEVARVAVDTGSRFLPVARGRTDNLLGYIDAAELLWRSDARLESLLHESVFYPETTALADLLLTMNRSHVEVAFLVDEFGGIAGTLTPSQIIGDIVHYTPERGPQGSRIERVASGHYRVSGDAGVEDLGHEIGLVLRRSYNRTIGGYISERLGAVPPRDATYTEGGWLFRITDRDARHVKEVEITRVKEGIEKA
jgi:CBS domain containing-hemolysin-like protein